MLLLAKTCCRIIILCFLAVLIAMPVLADTDRKSKLSDARHTVESFCKAEFEGDEFDQRVKLIKFSPAREKKEKKRTGPASPWVMFWDWDPYYIVSTYKVINVEIKDDRAVATVEYKRLAESKGKEKIIPSYVEHDIVKLNLVYDGKQWWIFDPPLPRISRDQLVKIYEGKLRRLDEKWLASASDEQKKSYDRAQKALKILNSLPN